MGLKDKLYRIESVDSEAKPIVWEGFPMAAERLGQGYLIAYLHPGSRVGEVRDGAILWLDSGPADELSLDDRFLSGICLFNESRELRYWRDDDRLIGRERRDGMGTATSFIDAGMVLRGAVAESLLSIFQVNKEQLLGIKTRNYISDNETGQSGYFDSRFVQIIRL
jgi:hypothetical protein